MSVLARALVFGAGLTAAVSPALAQEVDGPQPWQVGYQQPASHVMEYVDWFSWYTVVIMSVIVLLVIGLLAWCAWRYNERANPVPSRVTHNTTVEVLWTVIPVLVLVAIAVPSFRLLYGQYDPSKLYENFDPNTPFLGVKLTGVQWSWNVDYSNDEESAAHGVAEPISYAMFPIADDQLGEGQLRNLSVDYPVVVPVDAFVRLQVTAEGDAIHSAGMPAFGLKVDAVPGRLNETYFKAEREGIFYGQCSELCGKDHAFMPLAIRVVSAEAFRAWAAAAPADLDAANAALAAAIDGPTEHKLAAR